MLSEPEPLPPLDPEQSVLYIECCLNRRDYRQSAIQLHSQLADALRTLKPSLHLQLRINENIIPREGAFEVALSITPTEHVEERHLLWTGISRVPVSAKVPNVDDILWQACSILELRYSQAGASHINLLRTSDADIRKILQRHGRGSL